MPSANEPNPTPVPPPPASGHPSPESESEDAQTDTDANTQVPLIGNLPDGETAKGAVRGGREQPDGVGG